MVLIYVIWCLIGAGAAILLWSAIFMGPTATLGFFNANADAIKIAFSMIAVVYAATLYHQEFIGKRVQTTLDFSDKREEEDLRKALSEVNDHWIHGEGCEILRDHRQGNITNPDWADAALVYVRKQKIEKSVMDVHAFYTDLTICVERGRCDHKSACEIFANDIQNFRLTYRHFLKEWELAYETPVIGTLRAFKSGCEKKNFLPQSELLAQNSSGKVDFSCNAEDLSRP